MAKLFGNEMSRREIMECVGDISQIARITDYRFESGKAEGMRGLEVVTGSGLAFTVLPSRCMDIAYASYRGVPISFISKSGLASPAFFEKDGLGFLRTFTCGLLTTCGLTYMGAPCNDQGEFLGLNGRIGNIPATNCATHMEWIGDDLFFKIRGTIREASMFGDNLALTREITTMLGSSEINVSDTIENEGFSPSPFMLLYHCNFGYPVLGEHTKLLVNTSTVKPRDSRAEEGIGDWNVFHFPERDFTEQLFYFDIAEEKDGFAKAVIENPDILDNGLRISLKFRKDTLPYCSEWKQLGKGDYVLGIEPGTWLPEGRAKARQKKELLYLQPGEKYVTNLIWNIEEISTKN